MKIFVTGFHRAGTHAFAKYIAEEEGLAYIEESHIKWDSLELALALPDNSCIQCPGLAHKTIELAKFGKVIWCDRNELEIITSMKNASINEMAWHIVKGFHEQFPDDTIWKTLEYDGSEDMHHGFIRYYKLLIKIKKYFYETRFKSLCTKSVLTDLPIFDPDKTTVVLNPLREAELRFLNES